jgi:galactitol-specific phosphotransferase system IIB component
MPNLRRKVASKAKKVIEKLSQAETEPKLVDEGPPGPPGTPALPAAPPAEAVEEEVEKEIKEEKEEEAKLESVDDKLDNLTDQMETMVDALSDQKEILEETLLGKDKTEEKFEEFKEEKTLEVEEELSTDEFGLDETFTSTEEGTPMSKLRSARNERLEKDAQKMGDYEEDKTLTDEFMEDEAKKKTFSPSAPAPTITKVKKDETPMMFKLAELEMELSEDKSKWVILKASENEEALPLYEIIAIEDESFATEDFAKKIFSEMNEKGIEEVLAKYDAKKIAMPDEYSHEEEMDMENKEEAEEAVEEDKEEDMSMEEEHEEIKEKVEDLEEKVEDLEEKVEEEVEEKVEEEVAEELAEEVAEVAEEVVEEVKEMPMAMDMMMASKDYARKFKRAFKLALSAMQKNLVDNPLKAAFFDILANNLGMDEKQVKNVIEAAFSKGSEDHFDVALVETDKYLDMGDEAFIDVEATIGELQTKPVDENVKTATEADLLDSLQKELKRKAKEKSLPLSTRTEFERPNKQDLLNKALPKPAGYGINKSDIYKK